MKDSPVIINSGNLADGVNALLEALEPSDLPALEAAVKRISGFHALACQLLAAPAADAEALREQLAFAQNEVSDTDAHLADANERCDRYRAERDEQKRLNLELAERCAGQSALLGLRAEAVALPVTLPADVAERLVELARREPEAPAGGGAFDEQVAAARAAIAEVVEATPAVVLPSADGHEKGSVRGRGVFGSDAAGKESRARDNRLAVAKVLTYGPMKATPLGEAAGVPQGTMTSLMQSGGILGCGWWRKTDVNDRFSPYELTNKGRAALAEAGYVVAPVAEAAPEPAAEAPEVETPAPERIDPTDAKARALAQCQVIAEALRDAREPLSPHEISSKAGLPLDRVQKRLNTSGPSAPHGVPRYFLRTDAGLYKLTNAGHALAGEVPG